MRKSYTVALITASVLVNPLIAALGLDTTTGRMLVWWRGYDHCPCEWQLFLGHHGVHGDGYSDNIEIPDDSDFLLGHRGFVNGAATGFFLDVIALQPIP